MIEFEEHIYHDDPLNGHPDVRTRLKDTEYFFFGNGHIQGAIQYSPSGEGSPFGLIIMNPGRLSMKRAALTMDRVSGLASTALIISEKENDGQFCQKDKISWKSGSDIPVIEASWDFSGISVTEYFYCPAGIPLIGPGDHLLNPDSSVSQAIVYDIIEPESTLSLKTMKTLEELWNQTWEGGGYGRYNVTSEPDSPGPWPFPSLFIARAYLKMGRYNMVERVLNWLNEIPGGKSGSWFENYGNRISPPYPQVGIPPWTWAEIIMLVIKDIVGIEPAEDFIRIKPNLPSSINHLELTLPVNGIIIDLKIIRTGKSKNSEGVILPVMRKRVSILIEV